MDFPGRVIAGIIAIILILLFPLQYIAQLDNESIDTQVDQKTKTLSDTIRSKGYLDQDMYEDYIDFLNHTGEMYDVEISDIHPVTGEEITKHDTCDETSLLLVNERSSGIKISSIPIVDTLLTPVSSGITLFAVHTHTDDCYAGHRHTAVPANEFVHVHNHTSACHVYNQQVVIWTRCNNCGHVFNKFYQISFWNSSTNSENILNWATQSSCPNCGGTYYTDVKTDISYGYSCGFNSDTNGDGYYDQCSSVSYVTSTPDASSTPTDYRNGCYSYHVHGTAVASIADMINGTYTNYCYLPRYITLWLSKSSSYADPSSPFTATFEVSYSGGAIKLTFASASFYATTPPTMDLATFHYLSNNVAALKNWFISSFNAFLFAGTTCGSMIQGSEKVLICSKAAGSWYLSCGQTQDETPICNTVVTSISATNPTQTVDVGGSIITTAIATYLDGSTGTVNCTASGYNPNLVGTQTVTLTYSSLVGNAKTYGSRTCTINVTVRPNNIPSYLTIIPSATTVYNGTQPSYTVRVTYTNGNSKSLASNEYSISGWTSGPGTKYLTFYYTENAVTVTGSYTIYVKPNLFRIIVSPTSCSIDRYTNYLQGIFSVTALMEDGSNKTVTNYTVSGFNSSVLGQQIVTFSYTENGITKSANAQVTVTVMHRICPVCGNTYELRTDDSDPGCPFCSGKIIGITATPDYLEVTQGENLNIKVEAEYFNGSTRAVTGWTSNYNPNITGFQTVTVEYGGFADLITVWVNEKMILCPVCGTEYPASGDHCPYCAEHVVSITVSPAELTVQQYSLINLEVTAHYADGSSKIVTDWSIDKTAEKPGSYTATVSYHDATSNIKLTVISATAVQCPICGLIYEASEYPMGCPVCSKTITGIEAYLTTGTNLVQLGSLPSVAVAVIFLDSHRELINEGFTITDYDPSLLGEQRITITYLSYTCYLDIKVVDGLSSVTCPKGHVYYLNDDGTDPGCPYCTMSDGVVTIYYFEVTYITEILETVYTNGAYYFNEGNYITVQATKRNASLLTKVQNTFFRTAMLGRKKKFTFGGEVL